MSRQSAARSAASRQCPKCGRKSATYIVTNPGTVSRLCRWCDFEDTTVLNALFDDQEPS